MTICQGQLRAVERDWGVLHRRSQRCPVSVVKRKKHLACAGRLPMERASGRVREGDINHLLDCTEFYIQEIKPNYLLLIGDSTRERRSLAARVTEQDRLARARFPDASRCSWSAYLGEKGSEADAGVLLLLSRPGCGQQSSFP